jgi:hypothetical protein
MYSGKEVAIRAAIGAAIGALAMLAFRGWPSDAEKTASVVVAGVAGGLALVGRGLTLKRRIQWRQSGEGHSGPDVALWAVVGVIFVVFVALFIWLMLSAQAVR